MTIQYLMHLRDSMDIKHVRLYEIAYLAQSIDSLRSHKINDLTNIQAGYAKDGRYPGD